MSLKMHPLLRNISLDLTPERAKFNQAVISRIHALPDVNDFGTGAGDRADVDVPVTINKFKEIHHAFTVQELSSTDRNLVRESAEPIAEALSRHFVAAIAALWTTGNFPTEAVEAVADCDYQTLTAARKALNAAGAPKFRRFFVGDEDVYEKLLNDSTIIEADKNPGSSAIQTGEITNVAGFSSISEYPDIPSASNLIGFFGSPDSAVISGRLPADPREVLPNAPFPGVMQPISDPSSGFSVLATEHIDPNTLTANVRVIFMYGVAKGNAAHGIRLVHTATS